MKLCIVVGHSILKNGNITSANQIINEYKYCKELAIILVANLKKQNQKTDLLIIEEKKLTKRNEEKNYKLNILNSKKYDLIIELHLNSSENKNANGVECFYSNSKGKKYAEEIEKSLSKIFTIRNTNKKRTDLYMLNRNINDTILLETFFCSNSDDVNKGKDKEKIAELITKGILGKDYKEKIEYYRVQVGAFNIKENAERLKKELISKGYNDAFII